MLEIGDGGLTPTEDTTHFAMWCMLAAPLFLGTDIAKLTPAQLSLVSNPELIKIDQDPQGHEGHYVNAQSGVEEWMRPLSGGSYAVAMFNENTATTTVSATLAALGIPAGTYTVRDVVNRTDKPDTSTSLTMSPAGHGVVMVELTPKA
jgi:alpha-galactosidase